MAKKKYIEGNESKPRYLMDIIRKELSKRITPDVYVDEGGIASKIKEFINPGSENEIDDFSQNLWNHFLGQDNDLTIENDTVRLPDNIKKILGSAINGGLEKERASRIKQRDSLDKKISRMIDKGQDVSPDMINKLDTLRAKVNWIDDTLERVKTANEGKPTVFNEYDFNMDKEGELTDLSGLSSFTMFKDEEGKINVRDKYDFYSPNQSAPVKAVTTAMDKIIGTPFPIADKFREGGDTDDSDNPKRKYYKDQTEERKAKAWLDHWISKRHETLGKNYAEEKSGRLSFGDIFRSDEENGQIEAERQRKKRSSFKNYTYDYTDKEIPQSVLSSFAEGTFLEDKDKIDPYELSLLYRLQGSRGATMVSKGRIFYPSYPDMNTRIHENTHASEDLHFIENYNPQSAVIAKRKKDGYLLEGVKADPTYGDSSNEIYARLNSFRYLNNLDPKDRYTIDDVKKMRSDKNIKDDDLFKRYNDDFILFLLNDVAMNDAQDDDTFYAKEGGDTLVSKQKHIYKRLVEDYQLPSKQAIAVIANLTHESGLNTEALGDKGASFGIQQWKGKRRDNLYNFAKKRGNEVPTLDDQIDFLMNEYNNGQAFQFNLKGQNLYQTKKGKGITEASDYFQFSKADFDNADNLYDATIAWNQGVGRPHKKWAMNDRRYEIAKNLAGLFNVQDETESKYSEQGYSEEALAANMLPNVDVVAEAPSNTQDNSNQQKEDFFEKYGKTILAQLLANNTNNNITQTAKEQEVVAKEVEEQSGNNNTQDDRLNQLISSFLPNIQLNIKGVTQVGRNNG